MRCLFRLRAFPLVLVVAFLAPPAAGAQPFDSAAVDELLQQALKAWEVPGAAVAIVKGDEVIYLKGLGVRQLGQSQPVTPDTLFACASTSKAFTCTALAMLADDGKLSWDDPVRKHLEYFRLSDPLADQQVTLRDLVCHRTGLSRHDFLWLGSPWGREEVIRRIGQVKLTRPFRSAYQYQNIMYLTAGQTVGAVSKSSWEEFVQKRIFDPLGMTGANFSASVAEKAPDHSTPHLKKDGKVVVIPWRNIDNVGPAGSITAGVRDLSKWLRFQLGDGAFEGKRLISAKALLETRTPQMVVPLDGTSGVSSFTKRMNPETNLISYGLGWTIQDYHGHLLVSHGGSIDGFRAQVVLVPHARLGIAILSNRGRTSFPEAVRNGLVDLLLNLPKKDWNAHFLEQSAKAEARQKETDRKREEGRHKDTKPSRELAAYTGAYDEPAYGTARVTLENGALVLAWSNFKARLDHFHYDTFTARFDEPLEKQQVVFTLGADGEVEGLRFLEQEFKKFKAKEQK